MAFLVNMTSLALAISVDLSHTPAFEYAVKQRLIALLLYLIY